MSIDRTTTQEYMTQAINIHSQYNNGKATYIEVIETVVPIKDILIERQNALFANDVDKRLLEQYSIDIQALNAILSGAGYGKS